MIQLNPLSCRTIILLWTIPLLIVSTGSIALTSWWSHEKSISELSTSLSRQTMHRTSGRIESVLREAMLFSENVSRRPLPKLENAQPFEEMFNAILPSFRLHPEIAYVGFGIELTGEYAMLERGPDGVIRYQEYFDHPEQKTRKVRICPVDELQIIHDDSTVIDSKYDVRERPHYRLVKSAKGPRWTESYQFYGQGKWGKFPGVSYAVPMFDSQKQLIGVWDVDFSVYGLSEYLKKVRNDLPLGYPFLVESRINGELHAIALPDAGNALLNEQNELFNDLASVNDPAIREFAKFPRNQWFQDSEPMRFQVDDAEYEVSFQRINVESGPNWSVGLLSPRSLLLEPVRRQQRRQFLMIAMVGLFAIAGALVLAKFIAKPLKDLRVKADQLSNQEWPDKIKPSGFAEVQELATNFNAMAQKIVNYQHTLLQANDDSQRAQQRLELHRLQTPMGVIDWDVTGHVLEWNPAAERIFGLSRTEALGKHLSVMIPESAIEHVNQIWNELIELRGGRRSSNQNHKPDGQIIDCEWYNTPLIDASGTVIGVTSLVLDVTNQRLAEQKLRESEVRLAGLVETATDAIVTVDDQQQVILFNSSAERMFQITGEQIKGQSVDRLFPERHRVNHPLRFDSNEPSTRELGITGVSAIRANGTEFPIESSVSTLCVGSQRFRTAIIRDITNRIKREELLKESEQRFRSAFEGSPALMSITRVLDRTFVDMNQTWLKLLCLTREEVIGKTLQDIGIYIDPVQIDQAREQLLVGQSVHEIEFEAVLPTGAKLYALGSAFMIESSGERCVLWTSIDITKRHQAEAEIRHLNEVLEKRVLDRTAQLAATNQELEAFSYSVSHDLRSPLRAIDGFSMALLEDYSDVLDSQGKDYLTRVRGASQRMGQLIDDLLILSRVSRGELHRTTIDVSALSRQILDSIRSREPERNVEIEITPNLSLWGDRNLIQVALENLLENAWKYTRRTPNARIEIGSTEINGESVLMIRDNGAGFDPKYKDKLFKPFQRLHDVKDFEGNGVGLATVRRVINRHGGRIWAEAKVNEGAAFFMSLDSN